VVIIGAGFGGLSAANVLGRAPVNVTVVDRENHHLFQPLLYQVAMAALSTQDIAAPTRAVLRRFKNTTVLLAEVIGVDLPQRRVQLDVGVLSYDYLILAAGAEPNYFGHDEWESNAPGLKSLDDAVELRRRVLLAFELAEREGDPFRRRELLNFVIIGGGPTGVELAGALGELSRRVLAKEFRSIDPSSAQIYLLEAGSRILPTFAPDLSEKALRQLEELGIKVILDSRVVRVDEHGVTLTRGAHVSSATVVWAAGVRPTPLAAKLGVPRDRVGRIIVGEDLSIPGHPEAFAIGDLSSFTQDGAPLPGLSPVAMQEGRAAANAIIRTLRGQERKRFHYVDKGTMATIGRTRAIAQIARIHLSGWIAWFTWLFVHIWYLIGFRNRLAVLLNWAWTYITFRSGSRVITGLHHPPIPRRPTFVHDSICPPEPASVVAGSSFVPQPLHH
jgi:NADH dehydrogenase